MRPEILKHINAWLGTTEQVVRFSPQSGGDTSSVWWIHTSRQRTLVVKTNGTVDGQSFESEQEGLQHIAATDTIRTPSVLTLSTSPNYLVLEGIKTRPPNSSFWENAGHALAHLHRAEMGEYYGWNTNNFIGPSPQLNALTTDWSTFWRQYRLEPQVRWAQNNGLLESELETSVKSLMDRTEKWIVNERPCLIHGDLWAGNLLCSSTDEPVLIDPAVYLGHREADLSMTTLFGGFPSRFYHAYQEIWPLEPGWETRLQFYGLYHWLNHLNAFGKAYHPQCMRTVQSLLR